MTSKGVFDEARDHIQVTSKPVRLVQQLWTPVVGRKGLAPTLVILLFCGLAIGVILTKRPWCDEGWFANVAYNLMHHGVMGLNILDSHGFIFSPEVRGLDRYTYWVLPNYLFLQAAWCSIVGLNDFTFRLLSVIWGGVALFSWYCVVCRLTQNRSIGLLAVLILALDQNFILSGATGRMDMMCTALSLAASAAYLRLRRRFHLAVFTACSILAAALLTHPNALFGAVLLVAIIIGLDRSKIRVRTVLIAAAPFLTALGLWGMYVLQAPDIFLSQMRAQSKVPHRLELDWNLFRHLTREMEWRYVKAYHLGSLRSMATGSVVLLYFGGMLGLAAVRDLRNRPGAKLILSVAVIDFALLSCLQDNWYYLVHVLPAFAAAAAICLVWAWGRRSTFGRIAVLASLVTVMLNASVPVFRIVRNDYRGRYSPAVEYLKKNSGPHDLIMGSGELAFAFGFEGRVIDDCRLGFSSTKRPAYIVLEGHYNHFWLPWLSVNEPTTYSYINKTLDEYYNLVYDQEHDRSTTVGESGLPYRIYRRKGGE